MTRSDRRSLAMEFDIGASRLPMQTFGWGEKGMRERINGGEMWVTDNKDWPHHRAK